MKYLLSRYFERKIRIDDFFKIKDIFFYIVYHFPWQKFALGVIKDTWRDHKKDPVWSDISLSATSTPCVSRVLKYQKKACLIQKTFIFQICKQPQRLDVENLKNESFPNKTSYSSFWSVEATDFKNVILNKIHWAASEAAEV